MENHEFKFIDLRIDWAFKYVYGSPGNEDLLLSLIDAISSAAHTQDKSRPLQFAVKAGFLHQSLQIMQRRASTTDVIRVIKMFFEA